MLKKIQSFFHAKILSAKEGESAKEDINLPLATCAILVEMASADENFTREEHKLILELLKEKFSLSDSAAEELIYLTEKELAQSIDIWQFTHCINENFNREQKLQLIEYVWQIIYSDNALDKYEDYFVHKLQKLLRLTHEELIKAKLKAKNKK